MRVLIDTNILLDLVLKREPWDADARDLTAAVVLDRLEGYIAAHAVTTVHYFAAKRDRTRARDAVRDLLDAFAVAPVGGDELREALAPGISDYEDAVHVAAARRIGADLIITRDLGDFARSPVPARTPGEVLAML